MLFWPWFYRNLCSFGLWLFPFVGVIFWIQIKSLSRRALVRAQTPARRGSSECHKHCSHSLDAKFLQLPLSRGDNNSVKIHGSGSWSASKSNGFASDTSRSSHPSKNFRKIRRQTVQNSDIVNMKHNIVVYNLSNVHCVWSYVTCLSTQMCVLQVYDGVDLSHI